MMRRVDVTEFEADVDAFIDAVEAGELIVLTRDNRDVVMLEPTRHDAQDAACPAK